MKVQLPSERILALDIETRPTSAYVWRAYGEQNISPDQVIEPGGIICVGAKWVGQPDKSCLLFSDWEHGHTDMLIAIHDLMSQADAVLTYNGSKFDLRILQGEFLLNGLGPTPPCASIDILKDIRKLGYFQNKLAYIGPLLLGLDKVKHEGFTLWTKVIDGDTKAQATMAKYCRQDVNLLERLYLRIRPFIRNHPHLGGTAADECAACGSHHLQSRGTYRTRAFKVQRLNCQDCGAWQTGKRTKA